MNVFINPGHAPNGNPDPGAVNGNTGLRECDVALAVGDLVAPQLISELTLPVTLGNSSTVKPNAYRHKPLNMVVSYCAVDFLQFRMSWVL